MAITLEDIKKLRASVLDKATSIGSEIWSLIDNFNQNPNDPNQEYELVTLRDGFLEFMDKFNKTDFSINNFERSGLSADEINSQINNVIMPAFQSYEVYLEDTNNRIKDILNSNSNDEKLSQEEIDALVQQHDNIAQSGQGYVETNTETVVNNESTSTTNQNAIEGITLTQEEVDALHDKEKTPLLNSFTKYFDYTSQVNLLRSLDFAKSLIRFYAPKETVPENPKDLLAAAGNVFATKIAKKINPDEEFARFVVGKVNQDPGLVTFDMIGDLVKSDAYKNLGRNNTKDKREKSRFERWVLNKSMLAKMDENSPVNVVLAEDAMRTVVNELVTGEKSAKYKKQIDSIVKDFDDTFVEGFDEEKFNTLKNIIEAPTDSNEKYKDKLNKVFETLCVKPDLATVTNEIIETVYLGAETKNKRSVALCGIGTSANMCLEAVYKQVNKQGGLKSKQSAKNIFISEDDLKSLYVSPLDVSKTTKLFAKGEVLKDIGVTFGLSVGGTVLFSTIQNLMPFGNVVSAIVGVGGVVLQAFKTGNKEYQKAKLQAEKHGNGVVSKKELTKIGWKTGFATLKGMAPYLVAEIVNNSTLGKVLRGVGALAVGVKTFWADLERSAGLNDEYTQAVQKKLSKWFKPEKKDLLKTLKDNWKSAKEKGHLKSIFGHAAGKAAAVFGGSLLGRWAGDELSKSYKLTKINKGDLELTDAARKTTFEENNRQYVEGKQNDWWNAQEQATALKTLQDNGLSHDDAVAVLRKMGSAAIFKPEEFQGTLDNLLDGNLSVSDVDKIIEAVDIIDRTGDLITSGVDTSDNNKLSEFKYPIETESVVSKPSGKSSEDLITSGKDLDLVIGDVDTSDNANLPEYENPNKTEPVVNKSLDMVSVVSKPLDMVIDNVNTDEVVDLPDFKNPNIASTSKSVNLLINDVSSSTSSDLPEYVKPLSKETVTRESYQIRYGKKVLTNQNQTQGLER